MISSWLFWYSFVYICVNSLGANQTFQGPSSFLDGSILDRIRSPTSFGHNMTARMPLSARNAKILDRNGNLTNLHCVNWYGSHQMSSVPGGLHVQSFDVIVDRILELGFTCVRFPFSLDLWYQDPVVRDELVKANPSLKNLRGMQVFDLMVQAMANKGLMVILNNHNSDAGWCCSPDQEDSLWDTRHYPTKLWAECLAGMAERYRHIPLVCGFDIRNEVRDIVRDGVTVREVLWDDSNDVSNWKAASELAGQEILEKNPDMLIIVSGICYGFDLRPLHRLPPRIQEDKLVFTAHIYWWFLWYVAGTVIGFFNWGIIEAGCLALLCASTPIFVLLSALIVRYKVSAPSWVLMSSFGFWLIAMSTGLWFAMQYWVYLQRLAGCAQSAVRGADSDIEGVCRAGMGVGASLVVWAIAFRIMRGAECGAVRVVLSDVVQGDVPLAVITTPRDDAAHPRDIVPRDGVMMSDDTPPDIQMSSATPQDVGISDNTPRDARQQGVSKQQCRRICNACMILNACLVTCVLMIVSAVGLWTTRERDSYQMFEVVARGRVAADISRVPIFVGEIGTDRGEDAWFGNAMRYIREHDLHWGYWALDGQKYVQNETWTGWTEESYGLLDMNYSKFRQPKVLEILRESGL